MNDFYNPLVPPHTGCPIEVSEHVVCSSLNAERAIEIGLYRGEHALRPDRYTSWVEFRLAHAFPVVTTDGLALHPQVVANSAASLFGKVFNVGHVMKAYNPEENPRDRIVGSIFAVEFPAPRSGGYTVQGRRSEAPGIRAVACMHKQAEAVDRIIGQHQSGRRRWTVSRENDYYLEDSGFVVRADVAEFRGTTPRDFAALGCSYCPCVEAPDELMECYDPKKGRVARDYQGHKVVLLAGGLNGRVFFKGTGLTPLGKEAEAEIQQMLASGVDVAQIDDALQPDGCDQPLKKLSNLLKCV